MPSPRGLPRGSTTASESPEVAAKRALEPPAAGEGSAPKAPRLAPPEEVAAPTRRRNGRRAPLSVAAVDAVRREVADSEEAAPPRPDY